jgi:hypothetical protein
LDMECVVQEDEFLGEGEPESIGKFDAIIEEAFVCETGLRIGPGHGAFGEYRHKQIRWHEDMNAYSREADPKHAARIAETLGVADGKAVATPGSKSHIFVQDKNKIRNSVVSDKVDAYRKWLYNSLVGIARYIAEDRYDCQYTIGKLSRDLVEPTELSFTRLKRFARYLATVPRLVLYFQIQPMFKRASNHSSTDWAGDQLTRRSTTCGTLTLGSHCVATWVFLQQVVALPSGEAEFYFWETAAAHGLETRQIFAEMDIPLEVEIKSDSVAARGMCYLLAVGKVRYLKVRHLWIQQKI